MTKFGATFAGLLIVSAAWPAPAVALDEDEPPRRVRVALGPQLQPRFPGADDVELGPLVSVSITRGDEPFDFEAPDESFGFSIIDKGGFALGPSLNLQASRRASDIGAPLDKVSTTFEAGAFLQYQPSPRLRLRTEARRGIGGHDGWTGTISADFITRDRDAHVFSIGPRLTLSDGAYQRAYFGITPAESLRTGLPTYRPGSGIQAVGATAGFLAQFSPRWGIYSYARYDRLVDDAARSPVVRSLGSRDQYSGGIALSYIFGAAPSRAPDR